MGENTIEYVCACTRLKKEKELTLEEIFKNYAAEEFDWGSPDGKEVW